MPLTQLPHSCTHPLLPSLGTAVRNDARETREAISELLNNEDTLQSICLSQVCEKSINITTIHSVLKYYTHDDTLQSTACARCACNVRQSIIICKPSISMHVAAHQLTYLVTT